MLSTHDIILIQYFCRKWKRRKIFFSISSCNQNDLTLPETIFELLISQDESWCESYKFLPQLQENKSTPKN